MQDPGEVDREGKASTLVVLKIVEVFSSMSGKKKPTEGRSEECFRK